MMPNSYPRCCNFEPTPHNHLRFFFLHTLPLTIAFKLEYASFYEFYAKISQFAVKKCFSLAPINNVDVKMFGAK